MNHPFPLTRVAQICTGFALVSIVQVAAANDAEIVMVQGRVEVQDQKSGLWRNATAKQSLQAGDSVRTGDSSQMALLVKDKTQVRLNQLSTFKIKEAGDGEGGTSLELTSGRMWAQAKQFTIGLLRATTGLIKSQRKLAVTTPTATIGIRGTDWEVSVGDSGETVVSVFSGEVAVSNDLGEVSVGPSEQATVRNGMAPVKTVLTNARDRVQWVSAVRLDLDKYPDFAQTSQSQSVRDALAGQRIKDARDATEALISSADKATGIPAGAWLLAADFALLSGDMPLVARRLDEGQRRFSSDDRFPAYQARAALLKGYTAGARSLVNTARQKFPDSMELGLVDGELGRLEGNGDAAVASFGAASQKSPNDSRAWQGLGVTLAEQEDFDPARTALTRAVELAPKFAAPLADLGAMETRAQRLTQAQAAIDKSLELAPDDYVAWTSRGILLLTQGQPDAALQALLKAGLLEPRYAKAQLYTAIAWYQIGREDAALAALDRAKKADPNDPLPYFYEAQIQRDNLNPMAAVTAAREAMARFGYLKSLGPIATDRQGNANLGAAYAMFGLEAWAQRIAQQSQHPFFAGSYLFSAARTRDAFTLNSSLVQGYLTDPLMFGASPARSALIGKPSAYAAFDFSALKTDSNTELEPSFIANGTMSAPIPMAGFLQYAGYRSTSIDSPQTNAAPSLIVAVGFKPQSNLNLFLYRSEFRASLENNDIRSASDDLRGTDFKTNVGGSWSLDPKTAIWVYAGKTEGQSTVFGNARVYKRSQSIEQPEAGVRLTALRSSGEWAIGVEKARKSKLERTESTGRVASSDQHLSLEGESERVFGSWKRNFGDYLLQLDLNYSNFKFSLDETQLLTLNKGPLPLVTLPTISFQNNAVTPNIGVAWSPSSATTYRLAYQDVTRPAADVSLASQNTVGIPIDFPALEPGGRIKRSRIQGEWELFGNNFLTAFFDERSVLNLSLADGRPLNSAINTSQVRRLQQDSLGSVQSIDSAYGNDAFSGGSVRTTAVVFESILNEQFSWSAAYANNRTQNDFRPLTPVPDYPDHVLRFGARWFVLQGWVLGTAITGKTLRTKETFAGTVFLEPEWDLALNASWQDSAKRRYIELFTSGHLRKVDQPVYGARVIWRF
ncbi:MAG: hypothetical protein CFE43_00890 [Burkholderiales bacterium PBB3]|nr:MAG: hypothetical protein CFE43_00890 [Burkholderiales bacterium PBB3]